MAMNKADFFNALREAACEEFADVPRENLNYIFSFRFETAMEKLIKNERRPSWHFVNTARKRILIAVTILSALLATACTVPAIREPLVTFFVEMQETFYHISVQGEVSRKIEQEYLPAEIPQGFSEKYIIKEPAAIIRRYQNRDGEYFEFMQSASNGANIYYDVKNARQQDVIINSRKVNLYSNELYIKALWAQDGYVFMITYPTDTYPDSNRSINIFRMIKSVQASNYTDIDYPMDTRLQSTDGK